MGNSSTGKSALINGMIGENVAEESLDTLELGTVNLQVYSHPFGGITIKFWDSPGLQDNVDLDDEYISDMKAQGCANADLVLYCIKSNTRFHQEDQESIRNLTEGLGKGIWDNAIFVLTFANDVVARLNRKHQYRPGKKPVNEIFKGLLSTWKKVLIKEVIEAGINKEIILFSVFQLCLLVTR